MTNRGHATADGPATQPHATGRDLFDLVPFHDVRPVGTVGGWWEATGPQPAFLLVARDRMGNQGEDPHGALPTGWVHLTAEIAMPDPQDGIARLYFDHGAGFSDADRLPLFRTAGGRLRGVVPVPAGLRALRLDPLDQAGPFRLGPVRLRRIARPDAAARLLLAFLGRLGTGRPGLRIAARKALALWRGGGLGALRKRFAAKLLTFEGQPVLAPAATGDHLYARWIAENETSARQLDPAPPPAQRPDPRLSLLLVAEPGRAAALARTIESLRAQTFGPWECLVWLGPEAPPGTLPAADPRFVAVPNEAPTGEASNRAAALAVLAEAAAGGHLAVLRPGDVLPPTALEAVAAALAALPAPDILYTDEDVLPPGGARRDPALKPEWSPELLSAYDYFGSLTLLRRDLVREAGGFAPAMGPAAEWDLHLRAAAASRHIRRLPGILCHREPPNLQDRPRPDDPAAAFHRAAIRAHWARQGIAAQIETQPDGTQRSTWEIAEPPLVSIVIPTRDKPDLLRVCAEGLLRRTDYPRLEVILVDNLSADPATAALYEELLADARVRILRFEQPFNYSAACNAGARAAQGELLLFLNNDIEVTTPGWLAELVRFAQRPGVGVVGTRLVYPDGGLQHAGVVVGMHLCGLVFRGAAPGHWGPLGSPDVPRNWLAVMGACQMVRREVFDRTGSFDEDYRIANSDIALALQAWRAGWRTAYTPFAALTHHEGATRGHSNPPPDLARTAADIRALGFTEDPYWHPGLSALHGIPTLRVGADPSGSVGLRQDSARLLAPYPAPTRLDLFDDAAVAEAAGLPREAILWDPVLPAGIDGPWTAARWCIDLLRRRADLRERFPRALSEGAAGGFAKWLLGEGQAVFRLPDAACGHLRACFAASPVARVRQAVLVAQDLRAHDLREAIPLGFTPAGRHDLARWLFRTGRDAGRLRDEEIWWFLLECAEDPARELVRTFLFTPDWQRWFPDGLTVFGRRALARWLRLSYRIEGDWTDPAGWPVDLSPAEQVRLAWQAREAWRRRFPLALQDPAQAAALLAWLADPEAALPEEVRDWCAALAPGLPASSLAAAELTAPGVNIIGHFCYPSGLRTSVEALADGLRGQGFGLALRDVPANLSHDDPNQAAFTGLEPFGTTIIHVQPEPFFERAYALAGLHERQPRTHRVGYWYWEFDQVPAEWAAAGALVDELWAATAFVADALRDRFALPVFTLPPGIRLAPFSRRPRSHFGVPEGKYAFLFAFHMMSVMERKNPLGLIRAFQQAFSPDDAAVLVLKTTFGEDHPALLRELREAAAASGAAVLIIDRVFTQDETLSLMECCDAYVSLHRSEGFGLTMAEAMLLGKPTIATGYSGNTDFMDASNSLLVDHRLVRLERAVPPYEAGLRWAEPDEAHAAALLRRVFDQRDWAAALGAKARQDLAARMSVEAAGRRMAERLRAIRRQRAGG